MLDLAFPTTLFRMGGYPLDRFSSTRRHAAVVNGILFYSMDFEKHFITS
jgi:hypothetical protein